MGVLAIREEIKRFQGLERALSAERDVVYIRSERWKQAKTVEFWLDNLLWFIERAYTVAGAKVTKKTDFPEFKGYVNYVLSDENKAVFSSWDIDDHDLWLLVAGHNQCGYKLSVSFNPKNDTFNATYMCNDTSSPNAGFCLSAFAPDWYNAVKILAFKHDVVLDGVWNGQVAKQGALWG